MTQRAITRGWNILFQSVLGTSCPKPPSQRPGPLPGASAPIQHLFRLDVFFLSSIKIDLKRLFVAVIDHTTGPDHQLLFFKERFLPKDHPDRAKMARFSAKLRKIGLREETIGYGPSNPSTGLATQMQWMQNTARACV